MRKSRINKSAAARIVIAVLSVAIAAAGAPDLKAQSRSDAKGEAENQVVDPALFSKMEFRLIGPFRGGRSTTVTGIPGQPLTFFQGTTGGGVWKTTDAGESWENISDGFFGRCCMALE